jgi:hypothetical protein
MITFELDQDKDATKYVTMSQGHNKLRCHEMHLKRTKHDSSRSGSGPAATAAATTAETAEAAAVAAVCRCTGKLEQTHYSLDCSVCTESEFLPLKG